MHSDAQTTIEEIFEQHPEMVKVFMDFGIPCLVCGKPPWGIVTEESRNSPVDRVELPPSSMISDRLDGGEELPT